MWMLLKARTLALVVTARQSYMTEMATSTNAADSITARGLAEEQM